MARWDKDLSINSRQRHQANLYSNTQTPIQVTMSLPSQLNLNHGLFCHFETRNRFIFSSKIVFQLINVYFLMCNKKTHSRWFVGLRDGKEYIVVVVVFVEYSRWRNMRWLQQVRSTTVAMTCSLSNSHLQGFTRISKLNIIPSYAAGGF